MSSNKNKHKLLLPLHLNGECMLDVVSTLVPLELPSPPQVFIKADVAKRGKIDFAQFSALFRERLAGRPPAATTVPPSPSPQHQRVSPQKRQHALAKCQDGRGKPGVAAESEEGVSVAELDVTEPTTATTTSFGGGGRGEAAAPAAGDTYSLLPSPPAARGRQARRSWSAAPGPNGGPWSAVPGPNGGFGGGFNGGEGGGGGGRGGREIVSPYAMPAAAPAAGPAAPAHASDDDDVTQPPGDVTQSPLTPQQRDSLYATIPHLPLLPLSSPASGSSFSSSSIGRVGEESGSSNEAADPFSRYAATTTPIAAAAATMLSSGAGGGSGGGGETPLLLPRGRGGAASVATAGDKVLHGDAAAYLEAAAVPVRLTPSHEDASPRPTSISGSGGSHPAAASSAAGETAGAKDVGSATVSSPSRPDCLSQRVRLTLETAISHVRSASASSSASHRARRIAGSGGDGDEGDDDGDLLLDAKGQPVTDTHEVRGEVGNRGDSRWRDGWEWAQLGFVLTVAGRLTVKRNHRVACAYRPARTFNQKF